MLISSSRPQLGNSTGISCGGRTDLFWNDDKIYVKPRVRNISNIFTSLLFVHIFWLFVLTLQPTS